MQPIKSISILTAVTGSVREKKSEDVIFEAEKRYRFCGLPNGVNALPILAAIVCSTIT